MSRVIVASLCLATALAGCATGRQGPAEPEFVGRTMSVQANTGQVTMLRFYRDGRVEARFDRQQSQGRWNLERQRLCFTWAGNFRECWPYTRPFRRGETVTVRSDRGNVIRVTMR